MKDAHMRYASRDKFKRFNHQHNTSFWIYCLFPLTFLSVHLTYNGRTDKCGSTSEPHTFNNTLQMRQLHV